MRRRAALGAWLVAAASGCGGGGALLGTVDGAPAAIPPGATAGAVPAGLPQRLTVGLYAEHGDTWMSTSGVAWSVRHRFFVKGWADNFGFGDPDGSWGTDYMNECAAAGFIPGIMYMRLGGDVGGDTANTLPTLRVAATMAAYFADFKLLMQRVKAFGRPVLIVIEPTTFGYLEQQSRDDPTAPAAVASTGMPELAGLPDTLTGFGLAFLQLRKAAGAANALLAMNVEVWADGDDVAYYSLSKPLDDATARVARFLTPLGLAANVTGQTYDLLASSTAQHDADYDLMVNGQDRWFDPSDTAPIASRSFDRYAAWLARLNRRLARRWILWGMPVGNSNHLDVPNRGAPREGYKDNHAEYFFAPGADLHRTLFARAGALTLMFGGGGADQSGYTNDIYTDNAPFMQTHAGAYIRTGELPLP
jgi:hypothetical protein